MQEHRRILCATLPRYQTSTVYTCRNRLTYADVMSVVTTSRMDTSSGLSPSFEQKDPSRKGLLKPIKKKSRYFSSSTHKKLYKEHNLFMKRMEKERALRREFENRAAITVQRHFRGFADRSKLGIPDTERKIDFAPNRVIRDTKLLRVHILEMLSAFDTQEIQKKQAEIERKASSCDSLTSEWKIKHRLIKLRRQRTKREDNIKTRCATMMQAIIRGFLARQSVRFLSAQRRDETMHIAATAIGARAIYIITKRRVEAKRKMVRSESATNIQRVYRGWCERLFTRAYARYVEKLVQKVRAATLLQSNTRGMLLRLRSSRERTRHLRENAAKTMQGRCRIMLARKTSARLRRERDECDAARKIQSVIRGRIDRKIVAAERARRAEQERLRARIQMERAIDDAVSVSSNAYHSALRSSDEANEAFLAVVKKIQLEEEERLRKAKEEEEERLRKAKEEEEERLRKAKEEEEERLRKAKEEERLHKEKEKDKVDTEEGKEEAQEKEEEAVPEHIKEEEEQEEKDDDVKIHQNVEDESVESAAVSIQRVVRGAIGRREVEEKRNKRLEILRKNLEYLEQQPTQKIKKRKIGRPDRKYGSAVHYPLPKS